MRKPADHLGMKIHPSFFETAPHDRGHSFIVTQNDFRRSGNIDDLSTVRVDSGLNLVQW